MIITLYFLIMLIMQITLFIFALIKKQKINWRDLFIVEIISIVSTPLYAIIYSHISTSGGLSDLGFIIICFLALVCYVPCLIISIVVRIVLKNKLLTNQKKSNILSLVVIIAAIFVYFTYAGVKPLIDEKERQKDFSENVLSYLNNRYGDGNFSITDIYNWNNCRLGCINTGRHNAYEFTIQSSYLKSTFTVEMDIDTKKVDEDDFIGTYVSENNLCPQTGLEDCLKNIIIAKQNSYIENNNDYKVNLNISFDSTYGNKNYGKIPTLEELTEEAQIKFTSFTIYKDFDKQNEEDFKNFMIDVYKNYVKYYKKYNNSEIIDFNFINENPFFEDTLYGYYRNDGYIKETKDSLYIYNNASPIVVPVEELN